VKNDHADHENRGRPNSITPDELKIIHAHRVEAAMARQAEADRNLAAALRVGAALRAQDEG